MLKATKIRIYPTTEQAAFLNCQFGAVRFVYNTGLRIISHRYQHHGQSLSAKHDIKKLLPVAKKSRKYVCQHKRDAMPLSVRSWECPACHTQHDRDINAALNIKHQGIVKLKAEGLSVSAHGGLRKSGTSPAAA
ncbi:Putative transposase DNA-binding domain-containing protein [Ectothiorhodospira magna]|uniref:Putative transposase DNA-binding domain-containing protein n=1 Tax=Ectothiorhodospira magna TaxID=867345 RepID=A0A1H9EAN7_9GAMM|nr:helix-turn-helix domain-containing protein [Ectothiorhodospira magna]SEQ22750.1 Putative transposase DNA-binding domain-containing protein [Ectothiorhodospira magna]